MSNSSTSANAKDGGVASGSGGVQSVDRAVTVLEILARRGQAGVSEVALDIGVHKSTAFRLLSALEERGLVQQASDRGKYQLGFGILRLASAIPGGLDVVRQARSTLEELAADFGETVNLAVIRSHFAVNLAQVRGPAAVSAQNWIGELTPLHATSSGKILLAHQERKTQEALIDEAGLTRYTEHTITSRERFEQQLDAARADGYARTLEEYEIGLNAIATPVLDDGGHVIAAVSVSGPAFRLDQKRMNAIRANLVAASARISSRMGYLS